MTQSSISEDSRNPLEENCNYFARRRKNQPHFPAVYRNEFASNPKHKAFKNARMDGGAS
jgi:hypothetical protein